jgi:hypothetical protein
MAGYVFDRFGDQFGVVVVETGEGAAQGDENFFGKACGEEKYLAFAS